MLIEEIERYLDHFSHEVSIIDFGYHYRLQVLSYFFSISVQHLQENLVLGPEIIMQHGVCDTGLGSNQSCCRPLETFLRKQLFRCFQYLIFLVFFLLHKMDVVDF